MVAAPEAAIPMQIAESLAPHAPTFLMMPLIGFSIFLILVGIIVFSTMSSKTPGAMIMMLGMLIGGGAYFIIGKTESSIGKKR